MTNEKAKATKTTARKTADRALKKGPVTTEKTGAPTYEFGDVPPLKEKVDHTAATPSPSASSSTGSDTDEDNSCARLLGVGTDDYKYYSFKLQRPFKTLEDLIASEKGPATDGATDATTTATEEKKETPADDKQSPSPSPSPEAAVRSYENELHDAKEAAVQAYGRYQKAQRLANEAKEEYQRAIRNYQTLRDEIDREKQAEEAKRFAEQHNAQQSDVRELFDVLRRLDSIFGWW